MSLQTILMKYEKNKKSRLKADHFIKLISNWNINSHIEPKSQNNNPTFIKRCKSTCAYTYPPHITLLVFLNKRTKKKISKWTPLSPVQYHVHTEKTHTAGRGWRLAGENRSNLAKAEYSTIAEPMNQKFKEHNSFHDRINMCPEL